VTSIHRAEVAIGENVIVLGSCRSMGKPSYVSADLPQASVARKCRTVGDLETDREPTRRGFGRIIRRRTANHYLGDDQGEVPGSYGSGFPKRFHGILPVPRRLKPRCIVVSRGEMCPGVTNNAMTNVLMVLVCDREIYRRLLREWD
jgi:hypothetical protein